MSQDDGILEALQKLLVLDLYDRGLTQAAIARKLGKRTAWVNDFLRGIEQGKLEHTPQGHR
ncbi:MAG: hypothetical protein ACRD2L_04350 [Terriglobia bacterium]